MDTATEVGKAAPKEEDVLEATEAEMSLHLSPRVVAEMNTLLQARMTVCCVFNDDFQSLRKTHELQTEKNMAESDDMILCNLLYNVCHQQELQNRENEVSNTKDIELFRKFAENGLKHRAIRQMFYFAAWLTSRQHSLCALKEKVNMVLVKQRYLNWSRRRFPTVVRPVIICKTND